MSFMKLMQYCSIKYNDALANGINCYDLFGSGHVSFLLRC